MPSVTRRVAAAAGAVLLLTLFLPWYGGEIEEAVRPAEVPEGRYTAVTSFVDDGSGWSYLGVTDILVALAAVALVVLVVTARDRRALTVAAALGLAAAALIAFRIVATPPPPYSVSALKLGVPPSEKAPEIATQRTGPARRYGIFLAFAAAITAAGGAALAARREPTPD